METTNFNLIKDGAIGWGEHVRIDGVYSSGVRISWMRAGQGYTATVDVQLLGALVAAWWAQEHGVTVGPVTARVITKESHPDVWAVLERPNMPTEPLKPAP